jgi:hypothetical protein
LVFIPKIDRITSFLSKRRWEICKISPHRLARDKTGILLDMKEAMPVLMVVLSVEVTLRIGAHFELSRRTSHQGWT